MCGHAGLTVGAGAVGEHVRRAGCPVDQTKPSSYETGTNKTAKKGDSYPAVVQKRDALSLETRTFGVARLRGTHCVFDGWMQKPTWAKAAKSATGRCAIVVTSFVEGITCRRPDDKVFFILALAIGDDSFVILTTAAKETALLGERAKKSEGFGSGRCPLYASGEQAARWCASASAEDPAAVAAEIEAAAQTNALGLVTGAAKRGAVTQSRTLQDFWGAAPKKKAKSEPASSSHFAKVPGAPPPRPRLKVGRPMAAGRSDFGLNLPASASREAYRNAVGAFPGMAAHRRDQGFELVGVQTAEERSEANRQRAEQEGDVLEVDDDSSAVAEPPSQPALSAAVLAARKSAWSSRFDHTEDVPPDVRRAREAYDTADYNIFVNTGRHMTAEEHASLTELDIAFARPHEASAEALERREWARRAARSAKVVGKGEDSEVIEID